MISLKRRLGEAEGGGPSTEIARTMHPEQSLRGDSEVAERASSSRRLYRQSPALQYRYRRKKRLLFLRAFIGGAPPGRAAGARRAWRRRPRSCAGPRWRSAEASGSEWSASRPMPPPEEREGALSQSLGSSALSKKGPAGDVAGGAPRPTAKAQQRRGDCAFAGAQAELEQLAPPEGREEAPPAALKRLRSSRNCRVHKKIGRGGGGGFRSARPGRPSPPNERR